MPPPTAHDPRTHFADREGALRVTQEAGDIVAISLEGEFDMATAPKVVDAAERALDDRQHLILDLSDATFIDSSVLNAILATRKAALARERVVVLQVGTAAVVERVLELAAIEQVLPRASDRADAVETIHRLVASGDGS